MSKRNRNRNTTEQVNTVTETDIEEQVSTVSDTDEVTEVAVDENTIVVNSSSATEKSSIDYKTLIETIVRNGIPAKYFDPKFEFTWQNSSIELDIRDCDIIKCFGYPTEINERRSEYSVPHYLNLANKPVYLPCTIDGVYGVELFQHRKGIELFRSYIRKINTYIDDTNALIKFISENANDSESLTKIKDSFNTGFIKL